MYESKRNTRTQIDKDTGKVIQLVRFETLLRGHLLERAYNDPRRVADLAMQSDVRLLGTNELLLAIIREE